MSRKLIVCRFYASDRGAVYPLSRERQTTRKKDEQTTQDTLSLHDRTADVTEHMSTILLQKNGSEKGRGNTSIPTTPISTTHILYSTLFYFRFVVNSVHRRAVFVSVASGCQETLRSKFPLKQPPRLFLDAPFLLLTAACSNPCKPINPLSVVLLRQTTTCLLRRRCHPNYRSGNPAPRTIISPLSDRMQWWSVSCLFV